MTTWPIRYVAPAAGAVTAAVGATESRRTSTEPATLSSSLASIDAYSTVDRPWAVTGTVAVAPGTVVNAPLPPTRYFTEATGDDPGVPVTVTLTGDVVNHPLGGAGVAVAADAVGGVGGVAIEPMKNRTTELSPSGPVDTTVYTSLPVTTIDVAVVGARR